MTPETTVTTEKRINIPLLVLFLLSLILNGYLLYNWYQNNYAGGKSLKEQNRVLLATLSQSELSVDSLQQQYDLLEQRYQSILSEFEGIKSERDQALADVSAKTIRIRQLISQGGSNPKALVEAKSQIEALQKELNDKRVELDQVMQSKERFELEAKTSTAKADQLKKEKTKADEKNKVLEDKIKTAKFQIDELKVNPLRTKKGKMEVTDKSTRTDEIEVSFVIAESDLVEHGNKEISLRILGINGEVLGANNSSLVDSDKLVSMKQNIDYQGTTKKVTFKFKQEELYKKGGHTAEIWHEGERLVRTQFNLN